MAGPLDEIIDGTPDPLDAIINSAEGRPSEGALNYFLRRPLQQANASLANIIGTAAAPVVGPVSRMVQGEQLPAGTSGMGFSEANLAESVGLMRRIFGAAGFAPEDLPPPQTIPEHIGAAFPSATAFGAGTVAAAPAIAARLAGSASPAVSAIGRVAGDIASHPATTMRAIVTSEPGMVAARELARPQVESVFDPNSPSVASQVARATTMFAIEMLGSLPTERLGRAIPVPKSERFRPTIPHTEPILSDVSDPALAGRIARVRSVNFQDSIDRSIARALERTAEPGLDEATASRNLREGLLGARGYAKSEVDRAWSEVDQSIQGKPGGFIEAVEEMLAQANATPAAASNYPVELLQRIRAQLIKRGYYSPGTPGTHTTITPVGPTGQPVGATFVEGGGNAPITAGRVQVTPGQPGSQPRIVPQWRDVPVKELQEIRSQLLTESDRASATNVLQVRPNLALARNIDGLVEELTSSIDAIGSHIDPRFQAAYNYARDASRLYNERFTRGPVGALLMTTRQSPFAQSGVDIAIGGNRIPPTEVARRLLNPDETAMAVREAAQPFGAQLANPPLGGLAQARVARTADEAVRTMFTKDIMDHYTDLQNRAAKPRTIEDIPTEYSTQRGPVASAATRAQQWVRDNVPLLEGWTATTTRLANTVNRLNRLLVARDEHTQGILSQFIGRNATEVFEEALRAPNSKERFELLYNTFKNNPQFLEGAQRALIDMVTAGRGADPSEALRRMYQPQYRDALAAMFKNDPNKLDRLYKMLLDAQSTLGDTVSATASGRARVVPSRVRELDTTKARMVRGAATVAARIFGLQAGGIIARTLPFMGSAGSLSIPMRLGRGAAEYVTYQWLKNRRSALDIVKDAVFEPELEARLHDLAPGNFRDLAVQQKRISRYLRRLEAATNEDVDNLINQHGRKLYLEERQAVRDALADVRKGPFAE